MQSSKVEIMLSNLSSMIRFKYFIVIILVISTVTILRHQNCTAHFNILSPSSLSNVPLSRENLHQQLNNTEDQSTSLDDFSIWCLNMAHRLDTDEQLFQSNVFHAPTFDFTRLRRLPYYYSQWKSTPLLPRRFTPCQHSIVMRLFMIADRICRKNKIEYMIADGTLLGSLRHHDVIPWDTDADMMIADEGKDRFLDEFKQLNDSLIIHFVRGSRYDVREYYKLYFRNTPTAGDSSWNFPFLDIYVYLKNETHVWKMGASDEARESKYYYPLVLRPLGELWLPAPKQPRQLYDFDPFDECKSHYLDHSKEAYQDIITRKCNELKEFYPFVEQNNETMSTEVLKMNNTIIHTILYN